MPYIDPLRRRALREELLTGVAPPQIPGELHFLLTSQLLMYLEERGSSYATFNDCLGALEGAKLEFFRRIVVPYEDKKREENGDVY